MSERAVNASNASEVKQLRQEVRRLIGGAGKLNTDTDAARRLIAPLYARMELIEQRLESLSRQIAATEEAVDADQNEVREAAPTNTPPKQTSHTGREQFKVNALLQTQVEQLTAALELLRAECIRRDRELDRLREQSRIAQNTGRLEIIQALLPTIDGLDEALRTEQPLPAHQTPTPPATPFERMRAHTAALQQDSSITPEARATWRARMNLVRRRLLDILATAGVQPMHTQGQLFDPHRHVALEVIVASEQRPAGIIVAELRRGYLAGNRVLRPAEVVISSASGEPPQREQNGGTHSS